MKKICFAELQGITSKLDELYVSCQAAHQAQRKLEEVYGKGAVFHFPQCKATFPIRASDPHMLYSYLQCDERGKFLYSLDSTRIFRPHSEDFTDRFILTVTVHGVKQ